MEPTIPVSELVRLNENGQHQDQAEDSNIRGDNTNFERINALFENYKKSDNSYDYEAITSQDAKKISEYYTLIDWIDQLKIKVLHPKMKNLNYPHIKDAHGYKFTKKNQQSGKGKVTIYYYCEAYKECPVGLKLYFNEEDGSFVKVMIFYICLIRVLGYLYKRNCS